jgi:hypothetical protein
MSLRPHLKHHFYCQLGGPQEEGDEAQVHLITTFMADWVSQRRGEEPLDETGAYLNHHFDGWLSGPVRPEEEGRKQKKSLRPTTFMAD